MTKIITEYALTTRLDSDGNVVKQSKWKQVKQTKSKIGWRRYYMDAMDIFRMCNSSLENRMAIQCIESIKSGFVLEITYKVLAKQFDISDKTAKLFIKKMKDVGFIRGTRGIYLTNPYFYIPYGMTDEDIAISQNAWDLATVKEILE